MQDEAAIKNHQLQFSNCPRINLVLSKYE